MAQIVVGCAGQHNLDRQLKIRHVLKLPQPIPTR